MRTVLFCLVLSANALPEAHLRGRNRDRDLSVPEDAKSRFLGLASNEKPSVALAHGGAGEPAAFVEGTFQRRLQECSGAVGPDCDGNICPCSFLWMEDFYEPRSPKVNVAELSAANETTIYIPPLDSTSGGQAHRLHV
ncbi:unnamed protein product [Pelagomonas calceolata]|uniref:Uncharacterized protein n=1 Tax=Pelagomonas calceolata TaxID=35677 RepID=A0A8J2X376_9STRA|nr:unnamed protein product [Pelagomonas calceolata]|mmetsp:Transcript_4147/g.11854  ORF Transcript_4147/g.11854 Transcript_4147/m.11854 type:complete len:138 (+) Transcript_4147:210-623(+)